MTFVPTHINAGNECSQALELQEITQIVIINIFSCIRALCKLPLLVCSELHLTSHTSEDLVASILSTGLEGYTMWFLITICQRWTMLFICVTPINIVEVLIVLSNRLWNWVR